MKIEFDVNEVAKIIAQHAVNLGFVPAQTELEVVFYIENDKLLRVQVAKQ